MVSAKKWLILDVCFSGFWVNVKSDFFSFFKFKLQKLILFGFHFICQGLYYYFPFFSMHFMYKTHFFNPFLKGFVGFFI